MILQIDRLSCIGGRKTNDDTAMACQQEDSAWVYVGDGLGAYAGGKQASGAAGEPLMELCRRESFLPRERMVQGAEAADQAVKAVQQRTGGAMKTTMVFLAAEGNQARWMHVGDSRLYRFRDGRLLTQTQDHSVSQMAVLMGEITPQQIRFHEDRSRLLRALGAESSKPDISEAEELLQGDRFLLCTDGFWEYVTEEEMEQTLARAESPEDWLRDMERILTGRAPGDCDNYTAAAVFCGEEKPSLLGRLRKAIGRKESKREWKR